MKLQSKIPSCYPLLTLVIVCVATTHLTGCRAVLRTEADYFFFKQADLRQKYVEMSPTCVALMKREASQKALASSRLIEAAKKHVSNDTNAAQELEQMEKLTNLVYEDEMAVIKKLEEAIASNPGGQVYYYEFRDAGYGEVGFMVIKDGRIRVKEGVLGGKVLEKK